MFCVQQYCEKAGLVLACVQQYCRMAGLVLPCVQQYLVSVPCVQQYCQTACVQQYCVCSIWYNAGLFSIIQLGLFCSAVLLNGWSSAALCSAVFLYQKFSNWLVLNEAVIIYIVPQMFIMD